MKSNAFRQPTGAKSSKILSEHWRGHTIFITQLDLENPEVTWNGMFCNKHYSKRRI